MQVHTVQTVEEASTNVTPLSTQTFTPENTFHWDQKQTIARDSNHSNQIYIGVKLTLSDREVDQDMVAEATESIQYAKQEPTLYWRTNAWEVR